MKALMPFGLRGNTTDAEASSEDGRVVELFRSRAELKKQHEEQGQELQRLRDRLKQQEAATARIEEMFSGLEQRLESADSGLSTLVFYHLRALWSDGRTLIEQMVRDLAAGQEERERKAWALEGNRRNFQQRQACEAQLRNCEARLVDSRKALVTLDTRLARLNRWWHRWQRPKLAAKRPPLLAGLQDAESALAAARIAFERSESAGREDFPGITIEARRAINLAAIACAEVLCLRLSRSNLVASARAAMTRREPTTHYGDLAACIAIMSDIVKARGLLKARNGLTQEVARRSERLRQTAAYLGEEETVPIPESCDVSEGDVLVHGAQGVNATRLPNVLAEDTWDLFSVLLR